MPPKKEKTPAQLSDLSTEVLLLIFGNFCLHCCREYDQPRGVGTYQQHHEKRVRRRVRSQPEAKPWYAADRQALCSLCLVSKKIRAVAQSIMYHEFRLGHDDAAGTGIYSWERRIESFMWTTVARPELASAVKVVSIRPPLDQTFSVKEAKDTLLRIAKIRKIDLAAAWRKRLSLASPGEKAQWPWHYHAFVSSFLDLKGDANTISKLNKSLAYPWTRKALVSELVAMLVSQLPHVQYFHLRDRELWPPAGIRPSTFPSLGVATLPFTTIATDAPLSSLIGLAEDLKTLNIHAPKRGFPKRVPNLPSVTCLRITGVAMRDETLEFLLARCNGSLQTFVYEARYSENDENTAEDSFNDPIEGHFRPSFAIKNLASHQSSLKAFHLDLRGQEHFSTSGEPKFHLKNFEVLEDVLLSTNAIYALVEGGTDDLNSLVQLLPRSIVSLHLTVLGQNEASRLVDGLRGLVGTLQSQSDQFPKLRLIHHDYVGFSDGGDEGVELALRSLGVAFAFRSWPMAHLESPIH
ncbi:hypothetical protein B0T10DRAFT_210488 [Thelonectria olida]|uniref:Uncharacterized protein n=1 Tax=Thelonectria olida TaxID=1576542 RepID=A0A9P8W9W6_9HYPO|nr:hypothetical protein B0T10DRAFT_210488 [Thelonectria olida]